MPIPAHTSMINSNLRAVSKVGIQLWFLNPTKTFIIYAFRETLTVKPLHNGFILKSEINKLKEYIPSKFLTVPRAIPPFKVECSPAYIRLNRIRDGYEGGSTSAIAKLHYRIQGIKIIIVYNSAMSSIILTMKFSLLIAIRILTPNYRSTFQKRRRQIAQS